MVSGPDAGLTAGGAGGVFLAAGVGAPSAEFLRCGVVGICSGCSVELTVVPSVGEVEARIRRPAKAATASHHNQEPLCDLARGGLFRMYTVKSFQHTSGAAPQRAANGIATGLSCVGSRLMEVRISCNGRRGHRIIHNNRNLARIILLNLFVSSYVFASRTEPGALGDAAVADECPRFPPHPEAGVRIPAPTR